MPFNHDILAAHPIPSALHSCNEILWVICRHIILLKNHELFVPSMYGMDFMFQKTSSGPKYLGRRCWILLRMQSRYKSKIDLYTSSKEGPPKSSLSHFIVLVHVAKATQLWNVGAISLSMLAWSVTEAIIEQIQT